MATKPVLSSIAPMHRYLVVALTALFLASGTLLILLPAPANAETRPGGTLLNDEPARTYTTGWWWTETPDELQFKVPTKSNYYTAIACVNQASGEDFDLFAYSDYDMTQKIASSTKGSDKLDVVVIDGHTFTGNNQYAKVYKFTGSNWNNGIRIESDYHCVSADLYGSDTDANGRLEIGTYRYSLFEYHGTSTYTGTLRGDYPLVNMYDVYLHAGGQYKFAIDSVPSNERLSMHLFRGSGNLDDALASYTSSTSGGSLTFNYNPESSGYYGLLVLDENLGYTSSDTYRILITSDFNMKATPESKLIAPGLSTSFAIDVESLGITKDINLHYRWQSGSGNISTPTGALAKLNVAKVTPNGVETKRAYLNITTTSSMSAGTYYLTVYGNDTSTNGLRDKVRVTLRVSTNPDFFLSTTPDLRVISPGTSAKYTITMSTINSFSSNVTLSASSSPTSSTITFSFSPSTINAGTPTSILTVTTQTTSPVGTYALTISGTGGSLTRYANASMRIKDPIVIDLISPTSEELVSGVYSFKVKAGTPVDVKTVRITFGGKMINAGTLNMYYSSASGFWERSVNTYTYPDGACTMTVQAEDYASGVTGLGPVNFTLSNSAPNPIIRTPLDRSYVTGKSMSISVNTTSYVTSCRFKVDQNAWTPLARSGNTWTGTWDTTQITDGAHTLTVDAKDTAGLTGETSVTIFVDNNRPTCNLNSPIDGQYIEGTYTFRVVATDTVGVDHVDISLFGGTVTIPFNPITTSYEYSVTTSTKPDGMYTAYATAYDHVNLTQKSDTITFHIDNNDPALTINAPIDDEIIGGNYAISVYASDTYLNQVVYRIDSSGWQNCTGSQPSYGATMNTSALTDGAHTLTVRAMDNASHMTEQSIGFIVDNNAPTCNIVSPFKDAFMGGVHVFQVSSSDLVGIDRVVLSVFGDQVQTTFNRQNGYFETMLNTLNKADGSYSVTAVAYDLSGKSTSSDTIPFKVDNNPPEMTVKGLQTGDYVSGNISFVVNAIDAFLLDVTYSIDGGGWVNISNVWVTGNLLDGGHTLTFRARDSAGHSTTQTLSVIVDNNAPVCAVNSPVQGEFIGGAYKFRLSASDSVGIDRVEVNVFGSSFAAIYSSLSGYFEFNSDSSIQPDGIYSCYATAWDKSGKVTISSPVSFQVDNNAPVLKVLYPLDRMFVEGTVNLSVEVSDTFMDRTEYDIDGSGWIDISVMWNTTLYSDGRHTLTFRAMDLAGHSTSTQIEVTVDNNLPYAAISDPVPNQFLEGAALFKVVASDLVGLDSVKIEVFGAVLDMNYNSGSGYYEYRTDTRLIPDGTYEMNITVRDISGKTVSLGPRTFNLDNRVPSLVVNGLSSDDILEGSVLFDVNATDTFLDKVEYKVDASGWTDILDLLDTTTFQDGEHTLAIRAVDLSGKETSFTFNVLFDNQAPTCTINTPVQGEFVEGMITIRVTAFDLVKVDYVMIKVYNIEARVPYNSQTGYYEYSSNTITWGAGEDGVRNVTAKVYDLTGKSFSYGPVEFKVDNRAPTINIRSPKEGQVVSGMFFFDVDNSDVFKKGTDYNIDGASWQPVSIGWNTALVLDGRHEVTIRATDLAGHITTEVLYVIVDNHEPQMVLISPTKDQFVEGTFVFKISAYDEVGITRATIFLGTEERLLTFNAQTGYYEYILDTRTLLDGTYYLNGTVTDVAGRMVKTGTITFRIDNNAPDLIVESPVKDQLINGLFVVKARSVDKFPGLVSYSVDGTTWIEVTQPWDTKKVLDGIHTLTIRTVDQSGHRTEFKVDVVVDNSPPVISQATITPGMVLSNVQTIRFYAYDSIGIRQVTLSLDGASPFEIYRAEGGMYYEYLLDTRTLSDGDHTLTVNAIDRAGNLEGSTYGIKVDNTGPTIALDYYWIEGSSAVRIGKVKAGNSVVFEATVIDPSGVGSVMVNIDSLGWREMTPDSNLSNPDTYLLFWPTADEGEGVHVFQIRCTDKLGNENYVSGSINVKRVKDETSFIDRFVKALPVIWLLLFILLVVLLFVLLFTGVLTRWARGEGMPKKERTLDAPKSPSSAQDKGAQPKKSAPLMGKKGSDKVEEWETEDA
ncbi:MAG: Ig-like domain-containing protein [Candidatus Thermoplasmatota archaeon]|jgi:hypothetical protein|nr:Ig-like domain-containing protein [Candidatus Thermoplasmatota archaeon]